MPTTPNLELPYPASADTADVPRDIEALATKLDTIAVSAADWIEAALINGWTNFGQGFETAGYLKDAQGFVHLKGVLSPPGAGGTTVAFVFPVGYRPGATTDNPLAGDSAGVLQINSAGQMIVTFVSSIALGMSGITFLAEN